MGSASLQRILLWQATTALFRMTHCIIIPEQNNRLKLADCAVNYDTTQTEQLSHSVYACMRASVLSCAALRCTALHCTWMMVLIAHFLESGSQNITLCGI